MLYSKILAAYDGSDVSRRALESAIALTALSPETKLKVLTVFNLPSVMVGEAIVTAPPEENAEEYVHSQAVADEARRRTAELGQEKVQITTRQGLPAQVIVEQAEEWGAELIVIGSRGLSGIREFVLGSVSHYVVQHAHIPVLIVK